MIEIIQGDCLEELAKLESESIDLVYLDPPFFSQVDFGEYDDRWDSLEKYLAWIKPILSQIQRVMKATALFYLHCDHHCGHYLKVESDQIFGIENFRNEIIWSFNGGGYSKDDFPKKHATIFRYSKSDCYYYSQILMKFTELSKERLKHFKREFKEGTPITDVWSDISNTPKEYKHGYPTEKPELLLERIIRSSSQKGDIILDPMCGSGSSLIVTQKLERNGIGIDKNPRAVEIARKRVQPWIEQTRLQFTS